MKKQIIGALPAITLFAILCMLVTIFGGNLVDTGKAAVLELEDVWTVQVSLVEGPISWTHSVESKWVAQSYVQSLEEDEIYGGHWTIYLYGVEQDEGRWHERN